MNLDYNSANRKDLNIKGSQQLFAGIRGWVIIYNRKESRGIRGVRKVRKYWEPDGARECRDPKQYLAISSFVSLEIFRDFRGTGFSVSSRHFDFSIQGSFSDSFNSFRVARLFEIVRVLSCCSTRLEPIRSFQASYSDADTQPDSFWRFDSFRDSSTRFGYSQFFKRSDSVGWLGSSESFEQPDVSGSPDEVGWWLSVSEQVWRIRQIPSWMSACNYSIHRYLNIVEYVRFLPTVDRTTRHSRATRFFIYRVSRLSVISDMFLWYCKGVKVYFMGN